MSIASSSLVPYCSPTARSIQPQVSTIYRSGLTHKPFHCLPSSKPLPFKISEIIFCETAAGFPLATTQIIESYLGAPNAAVLLSGTLRALWRQKLATSRDANTIVVSEWQEALAVPERVLRHAHAYEKELFALDLSDIPIGPRVLEQVTRCCRMLRALNLNKCRITDNAHKVCKIISTLKDLQSLDLSHNLLSGNLVEKPLAPLTKLKNLRYLDLSGCVDSDDDGDNFVAEDLSSLETLPNLQTLLFNSNPNFGQRAEEAEIFAKLTSLRRIAMGGCAHLTNTFIRKLQALRPTLRIKHDELLPEAAAEAPSVHTITQSVATLTVVDDGDDQPA